MLRLKLFGPPTIERDDVPLTEFNNRKALALLFYLGLMPGQHQRHQIATLLWPDLSEEKALSNLRYNLWTLRQALGELPIEAGRLTIAFQESSQVWVDVHEFQARLNSQNRAAEPNGAQDITNLQRVVKLYRGDLLDGFELSGTPFFDEWLQEQRTHFHLKAVDILTQLSHDYTTHHHLPKALDTTRRLLELEPWHEQAHQQFMLVLTLSGQRTNALEHYEQYRQRLAAEMGLDPEPETMTLWQRIKAGSLSQIPDSTATLPETDRLLRPLFGRQTEYAWLIEQWETVCRSNQGKWVLIKGEAGVGKTRLMEEMGRYVGDQGALFLQGRCYEFSDSVTYQPIAAALRQNIPHLLSPELAIGNIWLAELAQLLPEIYEQYPNLPAPLTAEQGANRHHLFEAVTYFIRAMTTHRPLLLFIDDLQWVDPDTLDLLAYLIRRLTDVPFLLVGTSVPGETTDDHPLATLYQTLYREGLADELVLERLAEAAVAQIIKETFAHADDDLIQTLYRTSEGNPFILFEIIKELQEQGWLPASSAEQAANLKPNLSIPVGVQAMIQKRLARLSAPGKQLLALAAVIGHKFDARLLVAASDLSRQAVLDCLDDWLDRHLIREVSQQQVDSPAGVSLSPGDWAYDFSHDLIRTVIYDDLSRVRRQALHRQAGAALETLYADRLSKVIEDLARHYHRSSDSDKALIYVQQAAQQAKAVFAWPIALRRYQQAHHHLENLNGKFGLNTPLAVWRQRWEFLLGQAEAHHMQGQLEDQLNLLERVAEEAARWGDDEDRLRTIVEQLLYRPPLNDSNRYRTLAEQGIALARALIDGVSENVCRQALGDLDLEAARFDQALAHYELALIGEAQWKHPYEAAFCLIKISKTYLMTNRISRAFTCLKEAIAYARAGPYPDLLVWSLLETIRVYLFIGDLDKARDTCRDVLDLCTKIGFRLAIPVDLGLESYINTLTNRLDQAQEKGERAWTMAQEMGDRQIMAEIQGYLGHFHLANEEPDQALTHFEQVQALSNEVSSSRTVEALSYQAVAHLALAQFDQAVTCSHQAINRLVKRQNNVEAAQRIYLNHYKIMKATQQMAQAQVVLTQAREMMRRQSTEISLDDLSPLSLSPIREMFFTYLPWNREIVALSNLYFEPRGIS